MTMSEQAIKALTPTGKLRASINTGNPVLAKKDGAGGLPTGVSIDLAQAFAEGLGVALELVVFDTAAKSVDALGSGLACGFVENALARHGINGAAVAPATQ